MTRQAVSNCLPLEQGKETANGLIRQGSCDPCRVVTDGADGNPLWRCSGTGGICRVDKADELDWLYSEFGGIFCRKYLSVDLGED
ncbi:MAG TPA: hypothetical protein EYH05_12775 [Anaerolineae bacterium]|nr:hypothetical protein [Anaerolineae bacterium]